MDVRLLDPFDDAALARWYAVVDASQRDTSPGEPGETLTELRAAARAAALPDAPTRSVLLEAVDARGATVGAARLDLPQRDNLHVAGTELLHVLPAARRRGAGSALLSALGAAAVEQGRRELVVGLEETGAGRSTSPGRAFLLAHGLHCAITEVRRDLDLPVAEEQLAALEQACRRACDGYAVRTWQDRCPDDLLEDRAWLARRMSTDTPIGDLPLEEEEWDAERVRRRERVSAEAGRSTLGAGAVHSSTGRMVAFTEMALPLEEPERAYQWETLVLREHRGHRLGTLVKLANLRSAAARWPRTRYVSTWNATTNGPMIAVNEALGCRVEGAWSDWTLRLVPAAGPVEQVVPGAPAAAVGAGRLG